MASRPEGQPRPYNEKDMTGSDVRRRFLDFFAARGHKVVASSSLVPAHDPTLLFTNAGMNQFKDVFLGLEKRDYLRATSSQKCVRAGGKHNDLENVGFTHRHHTFFEMLGNFSFGDYFKKDAIAYAWELVTAASGYGLDRRLLYATVFHDDQAAYDLWTGGIGLPEDRVFRLGEKDNFWAMGETGPCGPCSEIHMDLGPAASEAGHTDCRFPCDCGRYLEIWNLVFMQFDRDATGRLAELPRPSIDTGAGLERLAAVLQGKISNFDSDLFQPIIAAAAQRAGTRYGAAAKSDISLRIIADHARATAFLIHDGVLPGNEGRGYVLRKIMRRGIRHGRLVGIEGPFFDAIAQSVAERMRDAYPDLAAAMPRIAPVIRAEEERFARTLALALKELEPLLAAGGKHANGVAELPGREMFRLYDTFGLPLDVMEEIAKERGMRLDVTGFEAEMETQRTRARASWKSAEKATASPLWRELSATPTVFEGYGTTYSRGCRVVALARSGPAHSGEAQPSAAQPQRVQTVEAGEEAEVVLDHTPFYAASGGQIGDRGQWLNSEGVVADVLDAYAPVAGLTVHRILARRPLREGAEVEAAVDVHRRDATRRNHTATHLLHAALRQVLGPHVKQAGSVVEPGRLRFDFTHYAPLAAEELEEIERLANEQILQNVEVTTEILPLERALATGAMALFGEKYREEVRVVRVPGFSQELCGGTHVRRTGDIGLFKIIHEGGVAAGVRRIEALTGEGAWLDDRQARERLHQLSQLLRAAEPELPAAVERLIGEQRRLEKELREAQMRAAQRASKSDWTARRREIAGVTVVAHRADGLDRSQLRNLMDELRRQVGSGVVALGAAVDGKTALLIGVTGDLKERLPAGKIIRSLPGVAGGGRPDLAEAGGKDAGALDGILEAVYAAVERLLAG